MSNLTALRGLNLDGTSISDAGMLALEQLSSLVNLSVADTRVSAGAAAELVERRPGLRVNRLDGSQAEAARRIAELGSSSCTVSGRDVVEVLLSGNLVVDSSLRHLSSLPRLRALIIRETQLSSALLSHAAELPELVLLDLEGSTVTDSWLQQMKEHKLPLKTLVLTRTDITDAGLKHLQGMPQLEWIEINNSQIGDVGLHHLKEIASLKAVFLLDTQVTDAGVSTLRKTIPQVKVRH